MKVKICGLKKAEHVQTAVACGADFIGFVFAESRRRISIEEAAHLAENIPASVKKVGVFVDPTWEKLQEAIEKVPLDMVQLHGQESSDFVAKIKVPVIKAFSISEGKLPAEIRQFKEHKGIIFLLDAPPAEFVGGSGEKFDWEKTDLDSLAGERIMIAGGLTPENVRQAIRFFHPFGVDVSSGVETNGEKDFQKISEFIRQAKGEKDYDLSSAR